MEAGGKQSGFMALHKDKLTPVFDSFFTNVRAVDLHVRVVCICVRAVLGHLSEKRFSIDFLQKHRLPY